MNTPRSLRVCSYSSSRARECLFSFDTIPLFALAGSQVVRGTSREAYARVRSVLFRVYVFAVVCV